MSQHFAALLIRHWQLERPGERRVEVVHIESGTRALCASLPQKMAWLDARAVAPPDGLDAIPDSPARDRQPGEAAR